MAELPDFSVFKAVFFYSFLILVSPVATFFVTKVLFFEALLGSSNPTSSVWSAVAAVAVLHVAVGLFIYKAYSESAKVSPEKDDKVD